MAHLNSGTGAKESRDLHKTIFRELELISKSKNRIDICIDSSQPRLLVGTDELKILFIGFKK